MTRRERKPGGKCGGMMCGWGTIEARKNAAEGIIGPARLFGTRQQLVARILKLCSMSDGSCSARCKTGRPGLSVRPKIRLPESGTDLITMLRCFLSFKTVVTSRNIMAFKIKFSRPKTGHPSRCTLFSTSCLQLLGRGDVAVSETCGAAVHVKPTGVITRTRSDT